MLRCQEELTFRCLLGWQTQRRRCINLLMRAPSAAVF